MKNQFEQHLKTSLENFEVKYNPAHWEDMHNRLNKTHIGKSLSAGKVLGIAAAVIATAGLVYFFSTNNTENNQPEKSVATAQNVSAPRVTKNSSSSSTSTEHNESGSNQKSASTNKSNNNSASASKENSSSNNATQKTVPVESPFNQSTNTAAENKTSDQEQMPVAIPSTLIASFHANQNLICTGTEVQFTSDATILCTYKWDFGDGKTSSGKTPSHVYKTAGNYIVKLRLTSVKDKTADEKKNTITARTSPSIDMNYSASNDNPSEINFEAKDGNIAEWSWDFGDKKTSSQQNPSHTYNKKGSYDAVVTAKTTFGCIASSERLVTIDTDYNLLAPTGFSPNGDGLNDTWMPVALQDGNYNFTLTIFDKSGNKIYETSDKNQPWNGANVKTGDMFLWKATVKNKNGETSNYQARITIAD